MITISVRLDEKRSTTSQYENKTVGVNLEASGLELHTTDQILQKTRDLFALAKAAVNTQFHDEAPVRAAAEPATNGNGNGNGYHAPPRTNGPVPHENGNGRRSFGRPDPEPTPKQRMLLKKIARERQLGPESIREIAERLVGKRLEQMDKRDMSALLDALIGGEAA